MEENERDPRGRTKIIIQLGYQDLVDLIGGDSQAEVELRDNIVQSFASRYLKGVANTKMVQNAADAAKMYVDSLYYEKSRSNSWNRTLKAEAIKMFNECLKSEMQDIYAEFSPDKLNATVSAKYTELNKRIEEKIDSLDLDNMINAAIELSVQRRINIGVEKRLGAIAAEINKTT